MKKIFLFVGIAFMAFSCSSDNNEDDNTPTAKLKQYPIDYIISVEDLNKAIDRNTEEEHPPILDYRSSDYGNLGFFIYYIENDFIVFDGCCPVEWGNKEIGEAPGKLNPFMLNNSSIKCQSCGSNFDANTLKPTFGKAEKLGLSLVQYKIELNEEKQEYHITNPNYKK